jgi:hypothetical protein
LRLIVKILVAAILISACTEPELKPKGVLSENVMAALLTDIHLAEGAKTGRQVMGDTLRVETYYQKILKKHNTSLRAFNKSYDFYAKQPQIMNGIYEEVVENLNRMEVRVPKWEKAEDKPQNDSTEAVLSKYQTDQALLDSLRKFSQDSTKKP